MPSCTDNRHAVHKFEEGWARWAGSSNPVLITTLYDLANIYCGVFGTCEKGVAKVNIEMRMQYTVAQQLYRAGKCVEVPRIANRCTQP